MSGKMAALQGEAHFFEESMNPMKVKEYLSRPKDVDKLKGMKWLLAMVSKGRDVSEFFSDVVKNMAVRSVEVKKMVYIYLVHYADNDAQSRELALLSINSFQNDLRGSNQLIKALALRVMTSIRVPDIIQIQLLAVRDCASDSSPYVRKCAANAIPKIFVLDPDQAPQLWQVMEKLLQDNNTMVLGSAVAAFTEVCPNKFELLHPVYRKLCHLLADVDEWGQMSILAALQRYVRSQFTNPQRGSSNVVDSSKAAQDPSQPPRKVKRRVVKRAFYSSEEDESTEEEFEEQDLSITTPEVGSVFTTSDADLGADLDPDHRLLLRCSLPLLKSRNSGVVLAVCTAHYYCSSRTGSTMNQVAKAMVRILRNRREIQFVVLDAIRTMVMDSPSVFRPFLQEFFVKASDPLFTCTLKLDVLTTLVTKDNCETILGELQTYVLHRDKSFVCAAVRAVGRVAQARPEAADQCLHGLLTLVTCSKTSVVVAEAVIVLRQLLQQNPDFEGTGNVVRRLSVLLLQSFLDPSDAEDKGSGKPKEHDQSGSSIAVVAGAARASLAQPGARASIIWTLGEYHQHISAVATDVLRVLAKAFPELEEEVKIQVLNFAVKLALRQPEDTKVQSLASFVLEMARFDLSHDLRDRARFMTSMLGLATADEGVDEAALLALNAKAGQVLLKRRPAPTVHGLQDRPPSGAGASHLVLGTLSAVVGHPINGYLPIPDWCSVQPDSSVREPPKEEPPALTTSARGGGGKNRKGDSESDFYSGSESESESESGSESGSSPEYSSEDGSESSSYDSASSSAAEDEESGSGSSNSEESVSDSEETSDDGDDSDSSVGSRSSESSESSSDSSSGDSSDSSATRGEEGQGLLVLGPGSSATAATTTYGASSPAPHTEDLTGLVERMRVAAREDSASPQLGMSAAVGGGLASLSTAGLAEPGGPVAGLARTPSTSSVLSADPEGDTSASFPSTLLGHQASGGLEVDYRYSRGRASALSRPSTTLSLRLIFANHGETAVRRIRAVAPRDGTPMEVFPEIQMLAAGATNTATLGIDFGGKAKNVRFELKTDKGSFMVSVEPPPEELLFPEPVSRAEFQRTQNSLGQLDSETVNCQVPIADVSRLPSRILRAVNAAVVTSSGGGPEVNQWWFSACSLAGSMSERVFIKVSADGVSGKLLLAHLFAAPLVRETTAGAEENEPVGILPIKQQNYAQERSIITRALAEAGREIAFLSEVADGHNFPINLTGCRVLHFTWNGDGNQEQVMFENPKGLAAPVTEDWLQSTCGSQKDKLPELVVLTAASAKLVAKVFIRAGISNVVAVDTGGDDAVTLRFVHSFYVNLAQGFTLRDSFDAGVHSLPDDEKGRCVLLPENGEHWVSPFDDAESGAFTYRTPCSPRKMSEKSRLSSFPGREVQVQEVYTHMVQQSKVITISGRPGIGKTEVALQACEYARERFLFEETFFVSLQDKNTGAPITSLKEVAARIASAVGISKQDRTDEGFLGCMHNKFDPKKGKFLVVLDGCSPYFVNEEDEKIKLSSVVETLCARVSKPQYLVTVVTQVGIATEKVVNIETLSELAAAELFVANAPREVTVEELRGGMVVSGPQVQIAECMRVFGGGVIMSALERHPGAIKAASSMLGQWHLLTHEDEYLQDIAVQLQRYNEMEQEFARRLEECQQTQSDSRERDSLERDWGRRMPKAIRHPRPVAPPPPPSPPARQSNGEYWWRLALENHTSDVGAFSQTIPWEALCKHGLAPYFLEVLGDEGADRPLVSEDFQALGKNSALWDPYPPPGNALAHQKDFLGAFWPWFKAATLLLKRTGCWGFQKYPVMCGLATTRLDGMKLLQGRPEGTFLLRLSSQAGALVVMYVKPMQELGNVLIRASAGTAKNGKFEMEYGKEVMVASLKKLIIFIPLLTHLFPDTPKHEAFAGVR
eukprot:g10069.t1